MPRHNEKIVRICRELLADFAELYELSDPHTQEQIMTIAEAWVILKDLEGAEQ